MVDIKITRTDFETFEVQLNITMQMELGLYVEPIPGQPDTYENEAKVFTKTADDLQDLTRVALGAVDKYKATIKQCEVFEDLELTYQDVHKLLTDEEPNDNITDAPFDASEDLMFQYTMLANIYQFIFEARFAIQE